MKKRRSHLEERLALWIQREGLPRPVREFRFARPRQWRFDFAWPELGLALEIEGGTWVQGRHGTGAGMRADAEKYNAATLDGWRILRVTSDMFRDGSAFSLVGQALRTRIAYIPRVLTPCDEARP